MLDIKIFYQPEFDIQLISLWINFLAEDTLSGVSVIFGQISSNSL